MIKPAKDWIYFEIKKIKAIGGITIPDRYSADKEEVTVLAIGPEVKDTKVNDVIIISPMSVVKHSEPSSSMKGFVQEANVIAYVAKTKEKVCQN